MKGKSEILSIFNNGDILASELISRELALSQAKIDNLENGLNSKLQGYFQNIELSERLITEAEKKRISLKNDFEQVSKSISNLAWAAQPTIQNLVNLRKNLRQGLDTLYDFLNISGQMKNLREMMKDARYYEHVQEKLLMISSLMDSMGEKTQANPRLEKAFQNFILEFKEAQILQQEFHQIILENIGRCLELSKTEPVKLKKSLKVIDAAEVSQPNEKLFEKAKGALSKMVERRFEERLQGTEEEIGQRLELAKFSVDDLLTIHQHLTPIFPPQYQLFDFMQKEYKQYVEQLVMPYLKDLNSLKENPGLIVLFISWLDGYGALLKKAGIAYSEYESLKEKVTEYIPFFMSHVEDLIKEWTTRILKLNEKDRSVERLSELLEDGSTLETPFSEDMFKFFSQQVNMLGEKLKGETFVRVIQIWADLLSDTFIEKATNCAKNSNLDNIISIPADLNDMNKALLHLSDTKTEVKDIAEPIYHEKIDKLFGIILKGISESVEIESARLSELLFEKIEDKIIGLLFRQTWLTGNIIEECMDALGSQITLVSEWVTNPLYIMRCIRLVSTRFVDLYIERLISSMKLLLPKEKSLKNYTPKVHSSKIIEEKEKTIKLKLLRDKYEDFCDKLKHDSELFSSTLDSFEGKIPKSASEYLRIRMYRAYMYSRLPSCDYIEGALNGDQSFNSEQDEITDLYLAIAISLLRKDLGPKTADMLVSHAP